MRYRQIGARSLLALLALLITLAVPLHIAGRIATLATASGIAASARPKHGHGKPSDHHAQQQWFYGQRAAPGTTIPAGAWLRALQQRASVPQVSATTPWTAIGPAPTATGPFNNTATSGRVTALAYDATHNIVYAGAADGGLWKSTDGGASWTPLSDTQPSLAVGAIALDPNNPQTIYVGTGEADFNIDAYYSAGILKSTDGGTTWTMLGQSIFGTHNLGCPTGSFFCGGPHIGKIAVDPHNSANVLVASDIGLYRSTDGGTTWSYITTCSGNDVITDLIVDGRSNPSRVYAACGYQFGSSSNGVYISTDGGATFSPTFTGNVGRVAIAMAPSSPSTLYLVASDPSTFASLGMWQSTNQGATWTHVTPAFSSGGPDLFGADACFSEEQGWYDMYVAVDPASASTVYVGGINVFKSTNTGTTFTDVTNVYSRLCGNPCPTNICIHPDEHALVFTGPGSFYVGNDGGVYSSTDGGTTWSDNNGNLAITQFYAGSTTANLPTNAVIYGGAQDNGTQKYTGSPVWAQVLFGDGGFTANDPSNSDTAYAETPHLAIFKTTDGGTTWSTSPVTTGINPSDKTLFIAPFVMDPSNPSRLLAGTDHLYETTNGAASWTQMSPSLAASTSNMFGAFSAIAVAPNAPSTIYVGTGDGKIWVTTDDGGSWTDITAGTVGTTGRYVTALAVNPTNAADVDVAFSGFSGAMGGHVYNSTNGGASWTDISTVLPDTPVNAIVRDPTNAQARYIGTDVGFFFTTDGGASWQQDQTGLPNTSIDQLFTDKDFTTFVAATHGRGMFTLPVSALRPPSNTPTPTATATLVPATSTPTNTPVPATSTPTSTPAPATNTPTATPVPATNTPTATPVPATNTPTATPSPFQFLAQGAFTLGDKTAASALTSGTTITWWSPMWSRVTTLSGGMAPSAFKGYARNTTEPLRCGQTWITSPGNSPPPPKMVPNVMGVIVTSKVTQSGSTITGNTLEIVIVKTNPGYNPATGSPGTGTIIGVVCHS